MLKNHFIFALRIFLGFVFLFSGLSKFSGLSSFNNVIISFHILPDQITPIVAIIIPSIETLCAVSLLLGVWIKYSTVVVIALLMLFIAAIIPMLGTESQFDCGCFGPFVQSKVDGMLLIRNIIMVVLLLLIFSYKTHLYTVLTFFLSGRRYESIDPTT